MSTSSRLFSAFFTALPGFIFFILFLLSGWLGREYWWETYLIVLLALLSSSLLFGSVFPTVFQKLRLHRPWLWILAQGFLAWIVALIVLGSLNLTPLCVGQNNGDGNNDLSMCMFMTALSGIVYTPVYLSILVVSSFLGHRMLRIKSKKLS
jgi:hypothetical protein